MSLIEIEPKTIEPDKLDSSSSRFGVMDAQALLHTMREILRERSPERLCTIGAIAVVAEMDTFVPGRPSDAVYTARVSPYNNFGYNSGFFGRLDVPFSSWPTSEEGFSHVCEGGGKMFWTPGEVPTSELLREINRKALPQSEQDYGYDAMILRPRSYLPPKSKTPYIIESI